MAQYFFFESLNGFFRRQIHITIFNSFVVAQSRQSYSHAIFSLENSSHILYRILYINMSKKAVLQIMRKILEVLLLRAEVCGLRVKEHCVKYLGNLVKLQYVD